MFINPREKSKKRCKLAQHLDMKLLTRICLTAFVLSCHCSQLLAAPSDVAPAPHVVAAPKPTQITRDSFISLWWSYDRLRYTLEDNDPSEASFTVKGNSILCQFRNEDKTELIADLSPNQVEELIGKLNRRQMSEQGRQGNNPKVLFTLIFSDNNNKDKDDNFAFFDEAAPSNNELEIYLRELAQMKFPQLFYVAPVDSTVPKAETINN